MKRLVLTQQGEEHCVGSVHVRPQLRGGRVLRSLHDRRTLLDLDLGGVAGVLLPRQHAHGFAVRAFGVQGDFAQCGGGVEQADRAAFEHLGNNVLGFCRVREQVT